MRRLPSRLRRLDDALADLPLEEPMLLTELDGFLTGVLLSREPILPDEWLQSIWGSDDSGVAPFEDPIDVQWFVDAVTARCDEIVRDLRRGKPQPIFDIDERNGETIWEPWIDGFAEAMALRPDGWAALATDDDAGVADALSRLSLLIAVAREESALDSVQLNALEDRAAGDIVEDLRRLHAAVGRDDARPADATGGAARTKIGRNEPCGCGSGRKSKRCCGQG